jgi:hypothetical protein
VILKTRGDCPSADPITSRHKGGRLLLTVDADALSRQAPGWLATWSWHAAERGCVPDWEELANRVLESVPLGLGTPYRLMHADYARSGYTDLGPQSRLQVFTPIMDPTVESGAPVKETVTGTDRSITVTTQAPPGLVGVETTWYAMRGDHMEPLRSEARIQGTLEPRTGPAQNPFANAHAPLWRLLIKGDQTTLFLLADTPRELEEATIAAVAGDCKRCIVPPRSVGVNPFVAISVNGKEVTVGLGSTLGRVIQAAGKRPEDVMATLTIAKPYAGKLTNIEFDRTKPSVLNLVLLGNEIVRW